MDTSDLMRNYRNIHHMCYTTTQTVTLCKRLETRLSRRTGDLHRKGSYGPEVSELLIPDTLHPYPSDRFEEPHVDEPAVLARDLIHEAGHNWLNDALAACGVKIPTDVAFFSPWKKTTRPAFGFLHACWAFPLTMLYSARMLDRVCGPVRTFLTAYLAQQYELLATTTDDHARALGLISDDALRHRLDTVHRAARDL